MDDSELEFMEECARRQGKTPEQAAEDDRKFWAGEE